MMAKSAGAMAQLNERMDPARIGEKAVAARERVIALSKGVGQQDGHFGALWAFLKLR